MAIRLRNNTGAISKIGYICKADPNEPNAYVYATAGDTNILGVISESVPYRALGSILTEGTAKVFVNDRVAKGGIIRLLKSTDNVSKGSCRLAKSTQAPYLQIGTALENGRGLVKCTLSIAYILTTNQAIAWNDVGNPPSRIVTDDTTELTTDYTIICNKATAIEITLLPATGSNRVREIVNIGAGDVTVVTDGDPSDPSSLDTIDENATYLLTQWDVLTIKDYTSTKWKIV